MRNRAETVKYVTSAHERLTTAYEEDLIENGLTYYMVLLTFEISFLLLHANFCRALCGRCAMICLVSGHIAYCTMNF